MTPGETTEVRAALYIAGGSTLMTCTRHAERAGLRIVTMIEDGSPSVGMGGARLNGLVDRLVQGEFEVIVADAGSGRVVTISAVPVEEAARRCAIYVRCASPSQASPHPLADQWDACEAYAAEQGWETVAVYRDNAVSGTKWSRLSLDRMMADAERGDFDVLLVDDLARLSRDAMRAYRLLDDLEGLGVTVHAIKGNGRRTSAVQADVVQGIFAAYAAGVSCQQIADALNGKAAS